MDEIYINRTIRPFDVLFHREWFAQNWHLSVYASVVYIICVANGQKWMKCRKAYRLKNVMLFWNISLSLFSLCGTSKLLPELISSVMNKGFYHSICNNSFKKSWQIEYWIWLFTWSKPLEFGDTLFIILRKQKLIFLHWTHHIITFIYCFFVYSDLPAITRWGITLNYAIHAIMYFYYALKVIKISVPTSAAKFITSVQTLQMFIGIITSTCALYYVVNGYNCDGSFSLEESNPLKSGGKTSEARCGSRRRSRRSGGRRGRKVRYRAVKRFLMIELEERGGKGSKRSKREGRRSRSGRRRRRSKRGH
ncbi:elongation of very long chain fatty acids protein 6-like [Oppia nitens]|uniref:elongation of very long chain fatty acids protein 6-like n=1 Tax=Oppia nitens TaxID=1686743 RepID=UPI0023DAAC04|nr:elongation of very long chain fatty acids protein 6-like [Oppia nitens]